MFDDLEIAKEKIDFYLYTLEKYITVQNSKGTTGPYLEAIEKVKKELSLFSNNIKNTLENFLEEIPSTRFSSLDEENFKKIKMLNYNFIDQGKLEVIQNFNSNLNERLSKINLNHIEEGMSVNDIEFYKSIMKSLDDVSRLRLEFLKFYREVKNKYKPSSTDMIKQESDFYNYVNEKKKELDMSFSSFENRIKSVVSKYDIASNDLDKVHELILEANSHIKKNYEELSGINSKVISLDAKYSRDVIELELKLDNKINEIEKELNNKSQSKLLKFINEVDETNELIMSEFNSIQNTTKKFSDFMKDETSNKLTNDFKNKAEGEMIAYYSFTALSFIIIFIAIMISWNTLHTFAEAHIGNAKNYNNLDLIYLSIRLIFSFIVFLSVTYTSRLASKSYMHWKKNEGIFLRLTALKSFIADMSEGKKEEIHEKLVDVYFGKDEQEHNLNQKLRDLPDNITQLLSKVVDQTSGVIDSARGNKKENSVSDKSDE